MKTIGLVLVVVGSWLFLLFCVWSLHSPDQDLNSKLSQVYFLGLALFTVTFVNAFRFPAQEGNSEWVPKKTVSVVFVLLFDIVMGICTVASAAH